MFNEGMLRVKAAKGISSEGLPFRFLGELGLSEDDTKANGRSQRGLPKSDAHKRMWWKGGVAANVRAEVCLFSG
ncbi:hypothetical protein BofuT4_P097400.1 [Botrytis cinerea T4]|uniref:Uncharacterized protein n=1 Tax=Botryotinia fuckeliana (strain T4) TaxID=999810 RepID=G2YCY4_BOTF4|nr:hypothetical protein BofuT4_P097400.1 [Botrytis cinerea T4]